MVPLETQPSIPEHVEEGDNNSEIQAECPQRNDSNPAFEAKSSEIASFAEPIKSIDPANPAPNCPMLPLVGEANNHHHSFQLSFIPGWKTLGSLEAKDEESLVRRSATIDNSSLRPLLRYSSTSGRVSRYNSRLTPSSP